MRFVNGKVVLETEQCVHCSGSGKTYHSITCPACKGTMRGPKGGRNGCRKCYLGKVTNFADKTKTCGGCDGTGRVNETRYSFVGRDLALQIPIELSDSTPTRQTFNDAYIGLGSIVSCSDYGRSQTWDLAKFVEELHKDDAHTFNTMQALNICDKDLNLCKAIVIHRNTGGYSLKARF